MTDREKCVVMAYTGICMLTGDRLNEYYKYLSELYGRSVYTHEMPHLDIQERAKNDFIKLCKSEEPGWIPCSERLPEEDGNYLIWFRYENALGNLSESMAMEYYADSTGWDCDNVAVIAWHPLPKPYKGAKMEGEQS